MKKYITPTLEVAEVEVQDLILASEYQITELVGVDQNGSKTAVFNANQFLF